MWSLLFKFCTFFPSFADRDMLMRYHWGLGVGHTYTYEQRRIFHSNHAEPNQNANECQEADEYANEFDGDGSPDKSASIELLGIRGSGSPLPESSNSDDSDDADWIDACDGDSEISSRDDGEGVISDDDDDMCHV